MTEFGKISKKENRSDLEGETDKPDSSEGNVNMIRKQSMISGVCLEASLIVTFERETLHVPQESSFSIPLKY